MLSTQLKMLLVCLCTFPKKQASSMPFSGGHTAPEHFGSVCLQLKQPFSFLFGGFGFQMQTCQRGPSMAIFSLAAS